jgi:hypothetical protein
LLDTAHHLKTGQAQLKNITFFLGGREEDRERETEKTREKAKMAGMI